jgi:hypothetical protein
MKAELAFGWSGRRRQEATTWIGCPMSTERQLPPRSIVAICSSSTLRLRANPKEASNMIAQELELFIHGRGAKPRSMVATPTETLHETLSRAGIIMDDETLVFVGECEEALAEPDEVEEGADVQAAVNVNLTLDVLEIELHRHVHCHTCRHVAVEVAFNGDTKRRRFSPSATICTVTQWARRKFRLDPTAAAEYVLQIVDTTEQPRSDKHLGELLEIGTCYLGLEFVREITPQG